MSEKFGRDLGNNSLHHKNLNIFGKIMRSMQIVSKKISLPWALNFFRYRQKNSCLTEITNPKHLVRVWKPRNLKILDQPRKILLDSEKSRREYKKLLPYLEKYTQSTLESPEDWKNLAWFFGLKYPPSQRGYLTPKFFCFLPETQKSRQNWNRIKLTHFTAKNVVTDGKSLVTRRQA